MDIDPSSVLFPVLQLTSYMKPVSPVSALVSPCTKMEDAVPHTSAMK